MKFKEEENKVKEAYWLDTQDRNRRDTIMNSILTVHDIRNLVYVLELNGEAE